MLFRGRIDLSEKIDVGRSNNSKECTVCHYCFFLTMGLDFKILSAMVIMIWRCCVWISDIAITAVKGNDYRYIINDINKSEAGFERLEKALTFIKSNVLDSANNMYLIVDSLIDINIITAGSNNITLRKFNVKPHGYDKMYMDKNLIEDELYELIDQFNKRKISHINFYFTLLDNEHPFFDGIGWTC